MDNGLSTPGNEPALLLGRGYTGHELLPWFGLINMNARLYDPQVGRFLSADPYVQAPDFTQAFNRYSYALNNPLKDTDETGEYTGVDELIAALIGGTINWATNGCLLSWQITAYCMMAIVQKKMGISRPIYEILQLVSVSLTEKTPLNKLFGKPNYNIVNELDGSTEPTLFDC